MGARGESAKYLAALKDVLYRVQPLAAPPAPPKKEEPVEDKPVVWVKIIFYEKLNKSQQGCILFDTPFQKNKK